MRYNDANARNGSCRGILTGGVARRHMPQGLSVRVRLLLIGPGAGMRVARGGLPSFGALRRNNTPTAACLSISGMSGTECSLSCI